MTKKQLLRCICFILVVGAVVTVLCEVFELVNTSNYSRRLKTYRDLKPNTVDAVWVGTSGVDRYWISAKAYDKYGMTVYPFAVNAMPTWLFTNAIDEVYAHQNPELIIIDVRAYSQNNVTKNAMDARARRLIDSMDFFSVNRIKTAFKTARIIHSVFEDKSKWDISYAVPFIKYHSKWSDEDFNLKENILPAEHLYVGFQMSYPSSIRKAEQKKWIYDVDYKADLDPLAEESLYELLDYVKEKNLNVLFVDTPKFKKKTEVGRANTVFEILDKHNVKYVNYSETDKDGNFIADFDFDYKTDFQDESHTNYYGAEKFTDVFSKYLDENYDLPDRKNDEDVKSDWDSKYDLILSEIKNYEKTKANSAQN